MGFFCIDGSIFEDSAVLEPGVRLLEPGAETLLSREPTGILEDKGFCGAGRPGPILLLLICCFLESTDIKLGLPVEAGLTGGPLE